MPQTSGSLSTPVPAHAPTVGRAILDRVAATPDRPAFRVPQEDGSWRTLTWRETGDEMMKLGAGLVALGLGVEDRVAIASSTRMEWVMADGAAMLAGGATTTIYPSTGDDDVWYILSDSGARIFVAEDANQAAKALHQRDRLPELARIIVIDGEGDGDFVVSWDQWRAMGVEQLASEPKIIEQRVSQTSSETLATLIYTSGTTGRPKGVELPHRCWVFEAASVEALDILNIDDVQYLWLPLSHVFGKFWLTVQLHLGFETAIDGRIDRAVAGLAAVRPTFMSGVPRLFEKIYQAANAKGRAPGGVKAAIFNWAFSTGIAVKEARREGRSAGPLADVQMAIADKLVFSKIRDITGGRIRYFISGSAALNRDVAKWFDAAGMLILEGYGLTETTAPTSVVRPTDVAFGTVGVPMPGTEAMIAEDGEILVRGPHIMRGYRGLPEVNAKALLPGGWFATGDIGEIDAHGRLRITDRKKDMVKTSGGKYIAPGAIEAQFKSMSALASNLIVHANNRNYATALVTLDPDALAKFAEEKGLSGDFAALSQTPEVRENIQATIDQLNSTLNRWETIKKFTILERDLSEAEGEITPSLKVKRKVVEDHFAGQLDAMYTG